MAAYEAEPGLKAEGLGGIAEAQKRRRAKEKGEDLTPLESSGVSFDIRKSIGELSDCKNNATIDQVGYIRKYRSKYACLFS